MDAPKNAIANHKIAFDVAEAATVVPLSPPQLYKEIREGRLAAKKCGKRLLIESGELERFVASLPSA